MKILIIEDDPATVMLVIAFLKFDRYDISFANDAQEGLDAAECQRPDLIILDYTLPSGNGQNIIRELRENPAFANLPVLVISGNSHPDRIIGVLKFGANDYLCKPFTGPDLRFRVRRLLGGQGELLTSPTPVHA